MQVEKQVGQCLFRLIFERIENELAVSVRKIDQTLERFDPRLVNFLAANFFVAIPKMQLYITNQLFTVVFLDRLFEVLSGQTLPFNLVKSVA